MYAGICDGNMEEGSLRCDANVSVHREGEPLGTRTEVKNVNSFRSLRTAIEFEIARQTSVLERGGMVDQETRLFDPVSGETRIMRSKEDARDYRYFPEPDLLTLVVDRAWIDDVAHTLPELPHIRAARYERELGLPHADAEALVVTRELAEYFEETLRRCGNARATANWVRNDVLRIGDFRITPAMLARLIQLLDSGAIGGKAAKEIFEDMAATGDGPDAIVTRKGLSQVSDPDAIREAARRVVERNATQVEQVRAGQEKVFGFLVGQLMKEMRGKANAEMANAILRELVGA